MRPPTRLPSLTAGSTPAIAVALAKAPGEIDDVFSGHPDIAQAVTFAIHDDRLGEEVATAIVPGTKGV
jgi:hypothetical protein